MITNTSPSRLYHFTSAQALRPISKHGLTVGDVPTDIARGRGAIGVWLTTSPDAGGHGLEGSSLNKSRYRLEVDIAEDSPRLHRWLDWAAAHVTEETIDLLHTVAARGVPSGHETWFVYFGVIGPTAIVACVDTLSGELIADWGELSPPELDVPAVPAFRRKAWQRRMLKQVKREIHRYG